MTEFEELLMYGLQAVKDDPDILGDENCFFFTNLRTKLLECVRKQMMKAAVEGQITLNEMGDPCVMLPSGFNAGDEVKLLIIKEDRI